MAKLKIAYYRDYQNVSTKRKCYPESKNSTGY